MKQNFTSRITFEGIHKKETTRNLFSAGFRVTVIISCLILFGCTTTKEIGDLTEANPEDISTIYRSGFTKFDEGRLVYLITKVNQQDVVDPIHGYPKFVYLEGGEVDIQILEIFIPESEWIARQAVSFATAALMPLAGAIASEFLMQQTIDKSWKGEAAQQNFNAEKGKIYKIKLSSQTGSVKDVEWHLEEYEPVPVQIPKGPPGMNGRRTTAAKNIQPISSEKNQESQGSNDNAPNGPPWMSRNRR